MCTFVCNSCHHYNKQDNGFWNHLTQEVKLKPLLQPLHLSYYFAMYLVLSLIYTFALALCAALNYSQCTQPLLFWPLTLIHWCLCAAGGWIWHACPSAEWHGWGEIGFVLMSASRFNNLYHRLQSCVSHRCMHSMPTDSHPWSFSFGESKQGVADS